MSNHVAWCRYISDEKTTRIVLCDSDSPGAFAVFRRPSNDDKALVRDLIDLWPDLRQLVDGFTVNSAWNNDWDAAVRQRMIDFGKKYLMNRRDEEARDGRA